MEIVSLDKARDENLQKYFTGIPCIRGHFSERYTSTRKCLDCCVFYDREFSKNDPQAARDKSKKWANNNPDKIHDMNTRWNVENPEKKLLSSKNYVKNNPEKVKLVKHKSMLKAKYNISLEDKAKMLDSQDGKCKICKNTIELISKNTHVDHCHKTGKVRSLLCHPCNTMIGLSGENPEILRLGADYIESFEVSS
jgi:hypothetical protein